ncbi:MULTISPECIES: hypothetical protein [Metallosphaera]|uniref:Uncharacterized protein n=4 Tax=Metallosphaera TaxID=41980 RepID=A4YIH1_METS5|nr:MULTISPECIES: hypothetical protein [Metallosphaera]ABP96223.1 hypothetical protein Msed_2083 [Metallosphaera sedula DSM 5348]AIM28206.1 hypothetical protein HA72_2083 [Metallosphaera sedula]MCY0861119.1 hypothetical protein [Metallosphaera prunae]QCO31291.1 hypothetical protein DFR88_07740 [Metallosphaera prunae]WPX06048.1 hypothetical protein SOJ17_002096 [Metallosphaera sedula DSM 5348]
MERLENLKLSLDQLKLSGTKENLIKVLIEISKLLPPSDDVAITLGKKGTHEYVIDRRGLAIITTSQDEYLPFLSSSEKRISMEQLPDDVAKKVMSDISSLLIQLRDILKAQARRNPSYGSLASEVDLIVKG